VTTIIIAVYTQIIIYNSGIKVSINSHEDTK